ncbi:MAG: aldolase/citrate lyase family protein [Chloroflexota bacterium]
MRHNTLKQKLAAGKRVVGFMLEFNSPELVEMMGRIGYDFVYIDGQHGGLTIETARDLMRAADYTGVTPICRVPRNDPSVILEFLDAGAFGIVVPNVNTRAQAEAAVSAMRYPPSGTRSGFARSRAANFGITQTAREYFSAINDQLMFMPLIEDIAAMPNLDAIAAVPGVSALATGPSDLGLSMGIVGGWGEPEIQANVDRVVAAGKAAGKPTIGVATSLEDGQRLFDRGFQAIQVSVAGLLHGSAAGFLRDVGRDR